MLIPIAIFGVLLILLIFFLVKSANTWNWVPITFVVLIFLTSIVGGIAASRSLKTRRAWKAQYLENEKTLARVKAEFEEALVGAPDAVGGYGEGSLRQVNSALRLAQIGKGRVWEGGSPVRNGEQYTITFNPAPDAPSPAGQIMQDMQLFAFEAADRIAVPGGGSPPAAAFVGVFKVTASDGINTVTLEPVFLTKFYLTGSLMRQLSAALSDGSNPDRINRLFIALEMELTGDLKTEFMNVWQSGQAGGDMTPLTNWLDQQAANFEPVRRWALFETMPGDSRDAFRIHAGLPPFDDDNPATPERLAEYRNLLATVYLPADLLGMDPQGARYEALLDEYTFDGVKTNEIAQYINQQRANRVSDRFVMAEDDENIVGVVRFNADSEAFQVDGSGNLATDGRFDLNGGANDPDLQLGKDVAFTSDTEVILPKIAATQGTDLGGGVRQPAIVDRNDAEWIGVEFFQRPLRDYPYQLRELRDLTRLSTSQRRAVEEDIRTTEKMIADTDAQKRHRSMVEISLKQDIESMQRALAEINRLHDQRARELETCRQQIRTYYNQIIELYKQSNRPDEFLDTGTGKPNPSVAGVPR
jgi:hypothetical protein